MIFVQFSSNIFNWVLLPQLVLSLADQCERQDNFIEDHYGMRLDSFSCVLVFKPQDHNLHAGAESLRSQEVRLLLEKGLDDGLNDLVSVLLVEFFDESLNDHVLALQVRESISIRKINSGNTKRFKL